jgi:hypothetical protein
LRRAFGVVAVLGVALALAFGVITAAGDAGALVAGHHAHAVAAAGVAGVPRIGWLTQRFTAAVSAVRSMSGAKTARAPPRTLPSQPPGRGGASSEDAPDPWATRESAAAAVASGKQPVDYATIGEGARVVLVGENHANTAIRAHLAGRAEHIRGAGFTHYGIEAGPAGQPAIDALHRGEAVDLSRVHLGPGRR